MTFSSFSVGFAIPENKDASSPASGRRAPAAKAAWAQAGMRSSSVGKCR